jgi:DNA-binding transcriptional regulator LsrR (DeoR family)
MQRPLADAASRSVAILCGINDARQACPMAERRSRRLRDGSNRELQVRAAWHYYVEDLTQEAISRTLAVSRAKVVRLLQAARENDVVTLRVAGKGGEQVALERRLVERFALAEAVVVPSAADDAHAAATVGRAAATYAIERMQDGMSIGIGWGTTLDHCARALRGAPRLQRASVVALLGGSTHSRGMNPSAVARRLADAFGAQCYQLTAPLVVANARLRTALWAEPGLSELRRRARRVDLALVSVGDVSEQATLFAEGLLPRAALATLSAAGAVGDVLCHFLDAQGREVDHPLRQRIVAVELEDLERVPRIVIASGGARKVGALAAALNAVRASALITDEAAARGLLAR